MHELRRVLIGTISAATWPFYVALLAYSAKLAPWPRDLAWPSCLILLSLSAALFLANVGRIAFRRAGWAEEVLLAPRPVARQLRRVVMTLSIAGFVLLVPEFLL